MVNSQSTMNVGLHRFLVFILIALSLPILAQNELGNPYIQNYNPKDYNSSGTIWDITQDNKGLMYFGVAEGVLQYDGSNWQTIPVDNQTTVRALDVDKNGRVYVGAKTEFGYLDKDSLNRPIYVSLSAKLDTHNLEFADVWNVYVTNDGVFFLTFNRIYRWYKNKFLTYEYDDITAHLGFFVNNKLFLVRENKGLHYFKDNDFVPVNGGDHFIKNSIYTILPYDENNVIVATRNSGLEILNTSTGVVIPFETNLNEALKESKVYHGTVSESGDFVIATLKRGVYVINKEGQLVMHINQENGLQNDNVKYVFKDNYGGLWAGTAVGISLINLNLPLTFSDVENGIIGFTRDIIRHNGTLYIATGNAVYYLDKNELDLKQKFKPIPRTDDQYWDFLIVNNHLLVGGSHGLYEIKDKEIKRIKNFESNALFSILQSRKHPNRIYLALKNGIAIAEITENDEIKVLHQFTEYTTESHQLGEDNKGNLWVATAFDFMVKIESSSFNSENGYPLKLKKIEYGEKLATEEIITINNELYFSSQEGLLTINEKDELVPSTPFKINSLPEKFIIRRLQEDKNGNLWVHYHYDKLSGQFLAIKNDNNSYDIKTAPFTRVNEKISHINSPYIEDNGIIWFHGGEGVVRYDYLKDISGRKDYFVNIRRVSLKSDSIINYGNNTSAEAADFQFSFNNNSTSFIFSAASYGNEKANQYQYFLDGYDENWSEWTTLSTKEYNYLPEGEYKFRVRAKNIYDQISQEDQFSFSILPPWYRETWAYIVYVALFLLLVFVIIKIATYRLQKSKRQLERVVEERTRDIVKEKEKVEQQKLLLEKVHHELAERNKDVMDSIKYAQHIQSAILPPMEKLKAEFKDSFIFYQPRDIVSGDFYWYEKIGDFFIMACVDCTGHGVPGAFMSLIGATLLNKIVEKNEVESAEHALTILDKEVSITLRQGYDLVKRNNADGMDLGLLAVNVKDQICHFSGAYRPLYLIRNSELIVFDSNRYSIGGGVDKEKVFTGVNIPIQSGDLLYLFTDGVTDQFGGEKGKKFKRDRLKKLLLENCNESMETQHQKIKEAFTNWKGNNEQIDDVLLMGIKIP